MLKQQINPWSITILSFVVMAALSMTLLAQVYTEENINKLAQLPKTSLDFNVESASNLVNELLVTKPFYNQFFDTLGIQPVYAQEQTTITSISPELNLEKTVTALLIPQDNELSWGFVEGKINNPAKEYPVIIQIFKNNDPIHFAQVNVGDDGTYEYKFRVRTIDDGKIIPIFDGEYTVNIFKVVRNPEWEMI